MRDELLAYYERELTFLRLMGAEYAEKYPKIAGRLILEEDKCEDPHVERMIEAFAFLAGRIHRKLDDELPEITESLLNVLYPHYLAPIPSMSVVQFAMDPAQAKLQTGQTIPRDLAMRVRRVTKVRRVRMARTTVTNSPAIPDMSRRDTAAGLARMAQALGSVSLPDHTGPSRSGNRESTLPVSARNTRERGCP